MRKLCETCKKKTIVIFDAAKNKNVCKDCKTAFVEIIRSRDFEVGDRVTRREGYEDRDGWCLPADQELTIEKISEDKMTLWFEENCLLGNVIESFYQFWEARNFDLVEK